ncbi:hypothetical protein C8Q72DRAFT_899738 [Fomitopsis betulina]|nr:hypothetical protein C8Q72DRAFT_899738 [Fomitopsis betulina]
MSFYQTDPDDIFGLDIVRFPNPFTQVGDGHYDVYDLEDDDFKECDTARTLIELRMCALSAAIREKPDWHAKFRDEKIRSRWAEEVREQQREVHESLQLTDNMINYVMTELEAYAVLRDVNTGIEPGPYERTWKSDRLIPASLKSELLAAVEPLESIPDSEKDWHPNSDGKVLDLVHPSLYPVIYERTVSMSGDIIKPREGGLIDPQFMSARFQWLPSDFHVAEDGSVLLTSPYINNVHPEDHAALERVIPKLLELAVPMFEWVLSDLGRKKQLPTRIDLKGKKHLECVWEGHRHRWPEPSITTEENEAMDTESRRLELAHYDEASDEEEVPDFYQILEFQRFDKLPKTWPESKPEYDGGLDEVKKTVDFRSKTMQVIVKLANIVLTPEKPEYGGGTWHVEGVDNEAIVATFIYYYECQNITESSLSFRDAVNALRYHCQDDNYCMYYLYGLKRDDCCVQDVGKISTKQDRCIVFPNLYQHLVSPFQLRDPTKPGHRKILVFFLVDPYVRIPSASTVVPQQVWWMQSAVAGTRLWERLPVELQDIIWAHVGGITKEEAEQYRLELMEERTAFVEVVDGQRFGTQFNMCEH